MAFSDLTTEQQSIIAEYTRQQRATIGEFARVLNHMESLDNMYDGQTVDAWTALNAGDVIGDASGLAGVSELSKGEVSSIADAIQALLTSYNTNALRQLYVKMAGMTNTIG